MKNAKAVLLSTSFAVAALGTTAGCTPNAVMTRMPSLAPEAYGFVSGKTEMVSVIPIGEAVTIPAGKSAMTMVVVIPQPKTEVGERQTQYVNYSSITTIDVTIAGENLDVPLRSTLKVGGASTVAGTVILNPGRNQIITAVAKDANGALVATVQGVATSLAGKVVDAVVNYGTTPAAKVLTALDASIAPRISLEVLDGVITPVMSPTLTSTGQTVYAKHPLFINPTPIVQAIHALLEEGTRPEAVSSAAIRAKLGAQSPVYSPGSVNARILDSRGVLYELPRIGQGMMAYPVDRDGDNVVDGAFLSSSVRNYSSLTFTLADPLTLPKGLSRASNDTAQMAQAMIDSVPIGTFGLTVTPSYLYRFPWELLPLSGGVTVSVEPGLTQVAEIRLVDVSKPVPVTAAGGNFIGRPLDWSRFNTEANLVYQIQYELNGRLNGTVPPNYYGGWFKVFDGRGIELFSSSTATGSFIFASNATNSLYVYTPYAAVAMTNYPYTETVPDSSTKVMVRTLSLADATGSFNAEIGFDR